ncbi:hypothetical protein [Vibrio spartinae]|uniref:Secretion system C-terminal sorting domain-containing protein n=1 Tax=Vibrio spartinae TaxID=1918945 RepID=A0ABX6QXI6_9VIBR|nr:hypothetical protein [Vibrio spartinae]QMV13868.1 hypothetical protein Vspart_01113 [Vibrio spartinae]
MDKLDILNINEVSFDLATADATYQTALNNINVINSSKLELQERTVKGLNLGNLGSFIGIWQGRNAPSSMTDFIGTVDLTASSSGGEWANKEIEVDSGYDLTQGIFTIGLFLRGGDVASLSASMWLTQGRANNPNPSSIYVVNPTNTQIPVNYSVPNLVDPKSNLDWVFLFKGDEIQLDYSKAIAYQEISSNDSNGIVNINANLSAGQYIVQYNPGHYKDTISATHAFTLR